jgi:hypothetical protein
MKAAKTPLSPLSTSGYVAGSACQPLIPATAGPE